MSNTNTDFSVDVGFVKIHLPDYTMSTFMIAQSLAEELGVDTNQQAIKILRAAIRSSDPTLAKALKTDYESGSVFIHASGKRGQEILRVAMFINELAIESYRQIFDQKYVDEVKDLLTKWKRPKPQKWKVGDVFSIPMADGSFSFGQVLWKRSNFNCALFELKDFAVPATNEILSSPVISVLNVGPQFLDGFKWIVLGNEPVEIKRDQVPIQHRGVSVVGALSVSAGVVRSLAEAYHGLRPWKAYQDELLFTGITRPESAILLGDQELKDYRKTNDSLRE